MFRANTDTNFVATKNISIKPESQITYNPQVNQVRFHIPQSLGFVDPASLFLKYNLQVTGDRTGSCRPNPRAGAISCWRDFRLQTGDGKAELEMISDMNALTAVVWDATENDSVNNVRTLFEGRDNSIDIAHQVYHGKPQDWTTEQATDNGSKQKIQIQHHIPHSGILGKDAKAFPVVATNGLRLQFTLEDVRRSSTQANSKGQGVISDGEDESWRSAMFMGNSTAKATTDDSKTTGATQEFFVDVITDNEALAIGNPFETGIAGASSASDNPFCIGDLLYIGNYVDRNKHEPLGIITSFQDEGGKMRVSYIPDRAATTALTNAYPPTVKDGNGTITGSGLFVKLADRLQDSTYANIGNTAVIKGYSWEITDLELVVNMVQPPDGYVSAMMNQVSSASGLTIDYRTNTLYRVNQPMTNGLTTQFIPCQQSRAYSILSCPLLESRQRSSDLLDAFACVTDNAQNYQYVIGGSLVPDRPVATNRLSMIPPKRDALYTIEYEKAITNTGAPVRNLWILADNRFVFKEDHEKFESVANFVIGRAVSRYGQVHNLANQDVSLRIEYNGATKSKLFQHFINHCNSLNISNKGVRVSR